MAPTIFIDGEAGTTGLQISERLSGRNDLKLLHLDDAERKVPLARIEGALKRGGMLAITNLPAEN